MRILFLILLLNICVAASGTVYYIDPAGSDANNGSSGSPWKSLSYACSRVRTAGDIIHVNAGNYTETAQSGLAAGVSIEGEGISSNIISEVSRASTFTILLSSSEEAANGNQHISGIRMDGSSLTAFGAIRVAYRKNVEIFNCTFVNFNYYGVSFINGEPPSVYATGNKFHDNTITNCSGYFSGNRGSLEIQGQDGMLIYNNTMTQNRSNGINGDIIYGVEGYLKNVKIYNNVMNKTYIPGTTNWDFAVELWNCQGGVEIYDNEINGSVDLLFATKGSSTYSVWIHNNRIGQSTLLSSESVRGILLEASNSDVIIERNSIHSVAAGIYLDVIGSARTVSNININANIIYNIGVSDNGDNSKGWGIIWTPESYANHAVSYISICNNVLIGHSGANSTMWGVNLPNIGTARNITLRNNIIRNFNYAPVYASTQTGSETIDILSIENNIFYDNGNGNAPKYTSITPTHNTTQNNLTSNPLFTSSTDLHLQSGSPAISKGIKAAGVTLDFDGNAFNDPPSIGAYEFDVPVVPVYRSSSVENATPSILGLNFNLSLTNIVPAPSAFSVMVNSVTRTVNSVAVSGSTVKLTLAGPVVYGDLITVTYIVPASNPLQTASGEHAPAFTAQRVTNNVTPLLPVYSRSSVENANPSLLVVTYNMALANITPAATAFTVSVNSSARSVSKVTVSGSTVQLTLASPVVYGNMVTVAYTKPSSSPLQSTSGAQAATLSAQKVTNNTVNRPPAVALISPTNNSQFKTGSDISITANASDAEGPVKSVEFYSGTTLLGTVTASPYTFTWKNVSAGTYRLTAVATDNVNTKTTSSAIPISVTDQAAIVNQAPVVMIANPNKGDQYDDPADINIEVIASDPDGTITKVELYNGSVKLKELTEAPYLYTWKGVPAGTYSIKAIATDNSSVATTSATIELLIGRRTTYDPNGDFINLYPNPSNGQFTVEVITPLQSDKADIIFTDLSGNKVYSEPMLKEETSKQFDLSRVRPGIYIMSVVDNQILITKKFIKK